MRILLLALTLAAFPVFASEAAEDKSKEIKDRSADTTVVTQSGIRIAGLDPAQGPIRPPQPFRLQSKADKAPKQQYKAVPPSFRSNIRFGFVEGARSNISYAGR